MAPAILLRLCRVIQHKKGGNQHRIPYAVALEYEHPPVDNVPVQYWVEPLRGSGEGEKAETIGEGIELYMRAYCAKFSGNETAERRRAMLRRFLRHLTAHGHSMMLIDLTQADGQCFLDMLTNTFDGSELSLSKKQDYRGALRSFSRFLADARLIAEDLLFTIRIQ